MNFSEVSRRSENRSLKEKRPSRTNGAYRFAIVTAPPGPSLIINNFLLAAPELHVSDVRRKFCPSSIRRREQHGAPLSDDTFAASQAGGTIGRLPLRNSAASLPSLFIVIVLFDKHCARAMHTSSGNLGFHLSRYSVLDFRCFAPSGSRSILSSPGLVVRNWWEWEAKR